MLLLSMLAASIVVLLAFSLSKDTGKNTKYARKSTKEITQKPESSHAKTASTVEIN